MNENIFWRAMRENDVRFDGVFFVGVKTTGIYCRPTCRARLPKRENVEFHISRESAVKGGFRACKRCKPELDTAISPKVETVIKACYVIEKSDVESLSLQTLGNETNVSPTYLQKVFKEIVGVSPKQYADEIRMQRFKRQVKRSGDVTNAMYEAGFGSSRGLYEKASERLGMTPATYKKGGQGMRINFTIIDSKLGRLLIGATEKGICSVTFGDDDKLLADNLFKEYPNAEFNLADDKFKNYAKTILSHLNGDQKTLDLPLDLRATAFQMRVWATLRQIPYGETRSYSDVAKEIGNERAVRAVARACATNPVALVTPCHRVIGSNGNLSGYRWGIERKKTLLETEHAN
jgi:AraC family transcriptional regulator, regulatory protein of adaptative response / methylated-DNA-[protein]-cysteine methyltransferase